MSYEPLSPEQVMAMANRTANLALRRPLFTAQEIALEWKPRLDDQDMKGRIAQDDRFHILWWRPNLESGPQVTLIINMGPDPDNALMVRWSEDGAHVLSPCKDSAHPMWDAYEAFCGARRPTTVVDALLFLAHLMGWNKF